MNQQEIKHAPVSNETWRPQRTQVLNFDPRKIRPLSDHVVIELDELPEPSKVIASPQTYAKDISTRQGTVISVGPGKYGKFRKNDGNWEIHKPNRFFPTELKPGQRVVIGHYSDWESHNCDSGCEGPNIVICQEADVRFIIN